MEYLQKLHSYKNQGIGGWLISEKLDGMRCFWDGGISRGKRKCDVGWANPNKGDMLCTGLFSTYGHPIYAPDWWLDLLPDTMLDGELYSEGYRQSLLSIVKRYEPGPGWEHVKYHVYDIGNSSFFEPREVRIAGKKIMFGDSSLLHGNSSLLHGNSVQFADVIVKLERFASRIVVPVPQEQLPFSDYEPVLYARLDSVLASGGEGLVIRAPHSIWEPKRSKNVLKIKGCYESEAKIIGFEEGKGKYEGMIGALVVEWNGVTFGLSGMTDSERVLGLFSVGDIVTFKYRDLTKDGVPQEARYFRRRND